MCLDELRSGRTSSARGATSGNDASSAASPRWRTATTSRSSIAPTSSIRRCRKARCAIITTLLMAKYGMSDSQATAMQQQMERTAAAEGLEFHLVGGVTGNTFDAHRLVHLGRERGLQDAVIERLFRAHFTEQRSIFDDAVARRAGGRGGAGRRRGTRGAGRRRIRRRGERRDCGRLAGSASQACRTSSSTAATPFPGPSPPELFAEALTARAADARMAPR